MKSYGIPRLPEIKYPDMKDTHFYALKSSRNSVKSKGGDYRNCFRSALKKANIRRIWKKKERARIRERLYREGDIDAR